MSSSRSRSSLPAPKVAPRGAQSGAFEDDLSNVFLWDFHTDGYAHVYIDGKLKATDSAFQKFTSCNKTLVRIGGLSAGTHTVTVTPLGTHAKASTGTKVSVDAIIAG